MYKHFCPWSHRLQCEGNGSVLRDAHFEYLLEVWAFASRTVRSCDPLAVPGARGNVSEKNLLDKCEITRLFDDPEKVLDFMAKGGMTRGICRDLKMAKFLWRETQKGFSLQRAKVIWAKEKRK